MLKVGTKAPDFTVEDDQGQKVSLKDFKGKKVVLYFYPKDNTPGCTTESCNFRDEYSKIKKAGAVILGVSKDSVASHQKFKEKYNLPFPLLSDPDLTILEPYGAWGDKKMYGKTYKGIIRSTYVIDEKGKIAAVFPKVNVKTHADEILKVLKEM